MIGTVIIGAILASLAYVWFLVLTAPIGYEDEDGFHLGDHEDD